MKTLIKPPKLNPGDKVAAVSLSWGGAKQPAVHTSGVWSDGRFEARERDRVRKAVQ
jgi:hypothetical protein